MITQELAAFADAQANETKLNQTKDFDLRQADSVVYPTRRQP